MVYWKTLPEHKDSKLLIGGVSRSRRKKKKTADNEEKSDILDNRKYHQHEHLHKIGQQGISHKFKVEIFKSVVHSTP